MNDIALMLLDYISIVEVVLLSFIVMFVIAGFSILIMLILDIDYKWLFIPLPLAILGGIIFSVLSYTSEDEVNTLNYEYYQYLTKSEIDTLMRCELLNDSDICKPSLYRGIVKSMVNERKAGIAKKDENVAFFGYTDIITTLDHNKLGYTGISASLNKTNNNNSRFVISEEVISKLNECSIPHALKVYDVVTSQEYINYLNHIVVCK